MLHQTRKAKYTKHVVNITCIKTHQMKSEVEISSKNNFDLVTALESIFPLFEIVFSYLDSKSLQNAALVKKSWSVIANRVLEKRNKMSWITFYKSDKFTTFFHSSKNYLYNNTNFGFIFCDYNEVNSYEYWNYREAINVEYKTVPCLCTKHLVPEHIDSCILYCPKISKIFTNEIKYTNNTNLIETIFNVFFIPPIQHIRIEKIYCKMKEAVKWKCSNREEKAKCLLLFSRYSIRPRNNVYKIINSLVQSENYEEVALGGGVVNQVTYNSTSSNDEILCIVFLENKLFDSNFNASSIVIQGDNLSDATFESELLMLRNQIILRETSIAFLICCNSKCNKEREFVLFKKIFPMTSMLGLEANGEIGWNTFNNSQKNYDLKRKRRKVQLKYPKVQHQWSTVIVLLTWGSLLNH